MKLLANFLPILIIYLIATYTPEAARFAHTSLGKLFAIIVILFYCSFDITSGLLVCAVVIVYYQSDYVESFEPMIKEGFEGGETDIVDEPNDSLQYDGALLDNSSSQDNEIIDFEMLPDAYPLEPTQQIVFDKTAKEFRQQFCKNGHLVHKGQIVKPEMSEHVFPEIVQADFHKCNICDPACSFNIRERNITAEEDLIKPKSSNDWFDKVWDNLQNSFRM
jgi:hypothetical protein